MKQQKRKVKQPKVQYVWLELRDEDRSGAMRPISCKNQTPDPNGVSMSGNAIEIRDWCPNLPQTTRSPPIIQFLLRMHFDQIQ